MSNSMSGLSHEAQRLDRELHAQAEKSNSLFSITKQLQSREPKYNFARQ